MILRLRCLTALCLCCSQLLHLGKGNHKSAHDTETFTVNRLATFRLRGCFQFLIHHLGQKLHGIEPIAAVQHEHRRDTLLRNGLCAER